MRLSGTQVDTLPSFNWPSFWDHSRAHVLPSEQGLGDTQWYPFFMCGRGSFPVSSLW